MQDQDPTAGPGQEQEGAGQELEAKEKEKKAEAMFGGEVLGVPEEARGAATTTGNGGQE